MIHTGFLFSLCIGISILVIFSCVIGDASARHNNENIIYKHKATSGSNSVTYTNDARYYYRETCKIHSDITISSVLHNGHKRNNPDSTFYPGDALEYNINVRFVGCSAVKTCSADVLPNNGVECVPLKATCIQRRSGCQHTGFTGYAGSGPRSESGTIIIPHDIYGPDESYSVTKKSYAMAKIIVRTTRGVYEGYSLVTSVANFPIRVIDPGLSTVLLHKPLTDSEGYFAANLDETYYVWDPINVVHKVDYKWKDERIGTIHVRHDQTHGILDNVHQYTCDKVSCVHTTPTLRGYDPQTLKHEYGGGLGIYNSSCTQGMTMIDEKPTCSAYHGRHNISYETTLYNIDSNSKIRTGIMRAQSIHNSTEPLIVQYAPTFSKPYPYISLKDDARDLGNWSWSKRHVMAIQYMGSLGGGRDDPDTAPHELRRALFNELDHSGNALFVTGTIPIDVTLDWSETGGLASRDDTRCDEYDTVLDDDNVLLFGRSNDSAMFTQAGYGRLYMSYPISDFMRDNSAQTATLQNTIQTSMFAGQDLRDLVSYNYTYPIARFGIPVSFVMMDSEGFVEHSNVSAKITPIPQRSNSFVSSETHSEDDPSYLHDYICQNVFKKTDDAQFANMVVSDMYPRTMNIHSTEGRLDFILNRTSAIFSDVYALIADSPSDLDINSIYETPSAYEFLYSVSVGNVNHTRNIISDVAFTSPLLEIANIDNDNVLDHTLSCIDCPHTTLQVRPRIGFGQIDSVAHNGKIVEGSCNTKDGCTLSSLKGANNTVTITNMWGGAAHTELFVQSSDATSDLSIDTYHIVTGIAIGIATIVLWRSFGAIINHFRIMIGAN